MFLCNNEIKLNVKRISLACTPFNTNRSNFIISFYKGKINSFVLPKEKWYKKQKNNVILKFLNALNQRIRLYKEIKKKSRITKAERRI